MAIVSRVSAYASIFGLAFLLMMFDSASSVLGAQITSQTLLAARSTGLLVLLFGLIMAAWELIKNTSLAKNMITVARREKWPIVIVSITPFLFLLFHFVALLTDTPERIILHQTMRDIGEKIEDEPSFRHEAILEPFLGKWMQIDGSILDIARSSWRWHVSIRVGAGESVTCLFTSGETISHAEKGDRVKVIGKLAIRPTSSTPYLESCELLDQIAPSQDREGSAPATGTG